MADRRPPITLAALAAVTGLAAAVGLAWTAAAEHGGTHSTEGVAVEPVPTFPALEPVAISDDGWVAATGSLWPGSGLPIVTGLAPNANFDILSMNDDETIVGAYSASGFDRGFARLVDGTFMSISAPSAGVGQWFRSIANDGSILGRYQAPPGDCGNTTAGACDFLLEANGDGSYTTHVLQDESDLPLFANRAVARADGEVLVLTTSAVWTPTDGLLPVTGDGTSTTWPVADANAAGELVGTGHRDGGSVGLYWASLGAAPVSVPPLPGHSHAQLVAIDGSGLAVGWSTSTPADLFSGLPFAWDARTGTTTPLGTLPGGTWARPVDVNDAGQVLGVSSSADGPVSVVWDLDATPPTTIESIPDQTLTVGNLLYLTPVVGGEPPVGFGLFGGTADAAGPPSTGAAVDATTGIFTWRAAEDQVGEHTFTLVAWTDVVGTASDIPDQPHTTFTVTVSARPAAVEVTLSDRITVTDAAVVRPSARLSLTDSVGLTDSVVLRPGARLSLADGITLADAVTVTPAGRSNVGDPVDIADSVTVTVVGDLNDLDPDGDGIRSAVDGRKGAKSFLDASTVASDEFSDAHRAGTPTSHAWGRITRRGAGALTVADDADETWGVRVAVAGAVGLARSTLAVCDGAHVLHLEGSTSLRLRCGSVWVAVDAGLAVLETSDGASIEIPAGSTAYLVDGDGTVRVEAYDGPLTIVNQWETRVLPAGATLEDPGLDTEPPQLTVTDLDATLPSGSTSGAVDYALPVASDNSGPVTAVCDPAPGATFGLGRTAVSCTATDPSGNRTTATFTVVVSAAPAGLPRTGASVAAASWATLLLAAGFALVITSRRRSGAA